MIRSRLSIPILYAILSPILSACNGSTPTAVSAPVLTNHHPSLAVSKPRTVACPIRATETVSGTIGAAGGALELAGGHRLEVPAGALAGPTLFTLTAPAGRMLVVVVTVQGTEPSRVSAAAALTISYQRCQRQKLAPVSASLSPTDAKRHGAPEVLPAETDRVGETIRFDVELSSDGEGPFFSRSTYAVAY